MKDIYKYIGILILIVFSFYYTDKISTMIIYKSDLMKEILDKKDEYEKDFVNAEIVGNYIIPGLNGLKINELDSYYQMKKSYTFTSSKLVYDEVEPQTTIEKNKDLIINRGNSIKKAVSIIIKNNGTIQKYCEENKINANVLITYEDFDKSSLLEQINDDTDIKKVDTLLDKYKLNSNICLLSENNSDVCKQNDKYLVKATYYIDNISIIGSEITSGSIIYISDDLSLANFKILLKKINYRDLDITYLSRLISEKREK